MSTSNSAVLLGKSANILFIIFCTRNTGYPSYDTENSINTLQIYDIKQKNLLIT